MSWKIKYKGYKPPPENSKRPDNPTPAPPPKKESFTLTMKDIDKLTIYYSDREIAYFMRSS